MAGNLSSKYEAQGSISRTAEKEKKKLSLTVAYIYNLSTQQAIVGRPPIIQLRRGGGKKVEMYAYNSVLGRCSPKPDGAAKRPDSY